MATDSFKFWDSYLEACEDYTDEEFGGLIRALASAVFYGKMPDFSDKSKYLKSTFRVMLAQAEQSRDIARQARAAAKRPRPNVRKGKASDALAHASGPSSDRKGEELSGSENSSPLTSNPPAPASPTGQTRPAGPDAPPPLP